MPAAVSMFPESRNRPSEFTKLVFTAAVLSCSWPPKNADKTSYFVSFNKQQLHLAAQKNILEPRTTPTTEGVTVYFDSNRKNFKKTLIIFARFQHKKSPNQVGLFEIAINWLSKSFAEKILT